MEFAYLDESGDLGAKGSKYIVLTLMCTSRKKEIIGIIRDTKSELLKHKHNKCSRWLNRNAGEIKYHGFPDKATLHRALKKLANIDMKIYYIALQKDGFKIEQENKYTIIGFLFKHILSENNPRAPDKVVADMEFFNKEKINRFHLLSYRPKPVEQVDENGKETTGVGTEVLFSRIDEEEFKKLRQTPENMIVSIEHQNSRLMEELQALDLISGSIYSSIENHNEECISILMNDKAKISGQKLTKK